MSIDEQPMNVYWSGKRTETSNNFKTNYKGSVATKNNLPSLGNKTGDMYNVTESGENFIWNGSSWDSLSGDALKTLNWQKSEKASTVAIYPVPETVLEPEVEFFLTETAPESGSKSPDNPSTISGVTSVSITHCESSGVNETEYNLPLNDVYYGGKVNFATGEITVTWVGETFTSVVKHSESLTNTISFRYDSVMTHGVWSLTESTLACNKFICASDQSDYEHIRLMGAADAENYSMRLYINKSRLDVSSAADPSNPTDDEWLQAANNLLSLNPVFIAYKINHPFTVVTNPLQIMSFPQQDKYTPQINTMYTSEVSVQVGYAKSPVRSEYELTQAIIATEGGE